MPPSGLISRFVCTPSFGDSGSRAAPVERSTISASFRIPTAEAALRTPGAND
jgi:hypothetical protein